jgi:hypothetical protein
VKTSHRSLNDRDIRPWDCVETARRSRMLCWLRREGPIVTTELKPLPKWKIDTMEAAIQNL